MLYTEILKKIGESGDGATHKLHVYGPLVDSLISTRNSVSKPSFLVQKLNTYHLQATFNTFTHDMDWRERMANALTLGSW